MADWNTQKITLLPYLQRASEVEGLDPLVAYYCRLYAALQGMTIEHRVEKVDAMLARILERLEEDEVKLHPDPETDAEQCERFAFKVYTKARQRDESGLSDRETAKCYYAAFNFFDILKQFGPLSIGAETTRRCAVFRAAEIKKCIEEGKAPPRVYPSD